MGIRGCFFVVVVSAMISVHCGGEDMAGPVEGAETGQEAEEGGEGSETPFSSCDEMNCDDGNPCSDDSCLGGECTHFPLLGSACDDGNECTTDDICDSASNCKGDGNVLCEDDNSCTVDTCINESGCVFTVMADGSDCTDGNACTTGDACQSGGCVGIETPCPSDDNPCTVSGGCDDKTGECLSQSVPEGTTCSDGNECTGDDQCTEGECAGGEPLICDDENPCTDDLCNPKNGCEFNMNDSFCDDGDLCTSNDGCSLGQCDGSTVSCDDGNDCTNDGCDPLSGCTYTHVALPCEDGNLCTVNDVCSGGQCASGESKNCDDGNVCSTEYCSLETGECLFEYNESACDDGIDCTSDDTCLNGNCQGEAFSCDDGIDCTIDSCDDDGSCVHEPDDGLCDSGTLCATDLCIPNIGCVVEAGPDCCGNGDVEGDEECDDENDVDGDGCSALCLWEDTPSFCGDGVVEGNEECDDENNDAGDGCSPSCLWETADACNGDLPIVVGETLGNKISNQTLFELDVPAGVESGDLLLAALTTNNYALANAPEGWWEVSSLTTGGNCGTQIFYRIVESNEPTSHSFSFPISTYASSLMIHYQNTNAFFPILDTSVVATGEYTPDPVTVSVPESLVALVLSSGNGMNSWATPGGWIQDYFGQQNSTSTGAFHRFQTSVGLVESVTAVPSVIDVGYAHLVVLNPCSLCGNGVQDSGEECDDANIADGDGCSPQCLLETEPPSTGGQVVSGSRRVFVTSMEYNGNLGGLVGADLKCQVGANLAGLGGVWKAWLSDSTEDAKDRLSHPDGNIVRVDGVLVAENWDSLVGSWPVNAPEIDEFGQQKPYVDSGGTGGCGWSSGYFFHPWTATDNEGYLDGAVCNDWTSTSGTGRVGLGGYSLSQWTTWCDFPCDWQQPLYCFEQ